MTNILRHIANKLGRPDPGTLEESSLNARFKELQDQATPRVTPAFKGMPLTASSEMLTLFKQHAKDNLFEITELSHVEQVPELVQSAGLPVLLSPQPAIGCLDWSHLKPRVDRADSPCLAVVEATGAIAETGTVTIESTDCPSAFLFLCEELAIVIRKSIVVPFMEDLWRQRDHRPRRVLHLISGPSRTADVEQTMQVGAHGPRRVYLYIVD